MGPISIYIPYAGTGERWTVRLETVVLSQHSTASLAKEAALAASEALAGHVARTVSIVIQAEDASWHPMSTFAPRTMTGGEAMFELAI